MGVAKRYGLIGKTLIHSFSQSFFEDFFKKQQINASYSNLEFGSKEDVISFLSNEVFQFSGLNVTIPFKETVMGAMDELTQEAKEIGAVNTIKVVKNRLIGHNTDAYGFHQSIKPFLTNQHQRALIIGTGGASKAVSYVLKGIGVDCFFISRNPTNEKAFSYNEINENMVNACKLIINTTPVGTFPNINEVIQFPYPYLGPEHLVIDLIYNPEETHFLKESKKYHARIMNGLIMLREQAKESWNFWQNESNTVL